MAEVLGGDSVEISCIIPWGEDPHFWFDQDLYTQAVSAMAKQEGVTEALKVADQMEWMRRINSIRNRAEEIILTELVYA